MTDEEILKGRGLDPAKYYIENDQIFERDPEEVVVKPVESGRIGSFMRGVRDNAGSVAGGLGAGAAALAAIGSAPVTLPVAAGLGLAGLAGSVLGGLGQDKLHDVSEKDEKGGSIFKTSDEQKAADKEQHYISTLAGGVAPMLIGGKPSLSQLKNLSTAARAIRDSNKLQAVEREAVNNALVNVGLGAGVPVAQKLAGQEVDPIEATLGVATGFGLAPWKSNGGTVTRRMSNRVKPEEIIPGKNGALYSDVTTPLPERADALQLQFALAKDPNVPNKKAVFVTADSPDVKNDIGGLVPYKVEKGTLYYNPEKLDAKTSMELARKSIKEVPGDLLGYSTSAKPSPEEIAKNGYALVTVTHNGVPDVITEMVPNNTEAITKAIAFHKSQKPANVADADWLVGTMELDELVQHRTIKPVTAKTDAATRQSEGINESLEELQAKKTKAETEQLNADKKAREDAWLAKQKADAEAEAKYQKEFKALELEEARQALRNVKAGDTVKLQLQKNLAKLEAEAAKASQAGDEAMTKASEATTAGEQEWVKQNDAIGESLARNAAERAKLPAAQQALIDKIANAKAAENPPAVKPQGAALPTIRTVQDSTLAGESPITETVVNRRKLRMKREGGLLNSDEAALRNEIMAENEAIPSAEEQALPKIIKGKKSKVEKIVEDLANTGDDTDAITKALQLPDDVAKEVSKVVRARADKGISELNNKKKGDNPFSPDKNFQEVEPSAELQTLLQGDDWKSHYYEPVAKTEFMTETPLAGKPEEVGAFMRHLANLGHQVFVEDAPMWVDKDSGKTIHGSESASSIPGRSNIETTTKFAETPAHEGVHAQLRNNQELNALVEKAVADRAKLAGTTPQEYVASLGGKRALEAFQKGDMGFWKSLFNSIKFHMGDTSDAVLGDQLARNLFSEAHQKGGSINKRSDGVSVPGVEKNFQPATLSALSRVRNQDAREGLEKAFNERTYLRGILGENLRQQLEQFPIEDVASTVRKHNQLYRTGTGPALNYNELPISRVLTDHMNMVENMQHASGYDREINGNPFYIPHELSQDVHTIASKGLNDPRYQEVVQTIGDYWDAQGVPDAHVAARDYMLGVSKARFGAVAVADADGFLALRKAAGVGLPESTKSGIPIRESDPIKNLTDYGRRAATDMAWQRNVVKKIKPEEIMVLESEKNSPWQQVREDYWNQNQPDNPTLRQANRLATSGVLGPLTGVVEVASAPHNAMLQGANITDVARAVASTVSNFRGARTEARRTGRLQEGADEHFGRVVGNEGIAPWLSKRADEISKYSGRTYLEAVSRTFSSEISRLTAERKLAEGDTRWFQNLMVDPAQPNAVEMAATTMTEIMQGRRDSRDLPAALTKGVLSDIMPIHKWAVGHAGEVARKVQVGDYSDLIKYVAGGLGVGVGRQLLSEFIKGRRTNDLNYDEIKAAGKLGTKYEAAWVVDILRAAGLGGALIDLASIPLNLSTGKQAQLIYNPLAETIQANLVQLPGQIYEAMEAGIPPLDILTSVSENIFRNSFQAFRIIDDLSKSTEQIAKEEDRRDLRTFEQLNGKKAFTGEFNPIISRKNRKFAEAETYEEAKAAVKDTTVKRTPRNYVMPAEPEAYVDYLSKTSDPKLDRKLARSGRLEEVKPWKRVLLQER